MPKSKPKHTELPHFNTGRARQYEKDRTFWHVDILNSSKTIRIAKVAGVGREEAEENAAFLVLAANNHYKLIDEVKSLLEIARNPELFTGKDIKRSGVFSRHAKIGQAQTAIHEAEKEA